MGNEDLLPRPVQQGLHKLISKNLGFARLLPKDNQVGLLFKQRDRREIMKVFEKYKIERNSPIAKAIEELIISPEVIMFKNLQSDVTDYIWGHKGSSHAIIKAVFQSLVFGELEFCIRDLPQGSHEERLTGHLLSKLYSSLLFCTPSIENIGSELYGEKTIVQIAYHDLSIGNREKTTGSDFGIILHLNLPDGEEMVSYAAFQAKKIKKKNAYIPKEQLRNQIMYGSEIGAFCCFYHIDSNEKALLPPVVLPSIKIEEIGDLTAKNYRVDREGLEELGIPLSLFLILMMESRIKCPRDKQIYSAKNFMIYGERERNRGEYPGPSRVLSVSIGGIGRNQELRNLTDLFGPKETSSSDYGFDKEF